MRTILATARPSLWLKKPMVRDDLFHASHNSNPLEEATNRVIGAIKARLLSPGDRLPAERELAAQLGISRSTLRVALQTLTDQGWLEVRRGRHGGSFVARWPHMPHPRTLDEVLERYRDSLPALLDYRQAVEAAAARLAAERATVEDIVQLEALNNTMLKQQSDYEAYRTADSRFHIGVARAAQSPRIMQTVTEVTATLSEVFDVLIYQTRHSMEDAARHHRQILDAIRDHNGEQAQALMLEHVHATEQAIYKLVQERAL